MRDGAPLFRIGRRDHGIILGKLIALAIFGGCHSIDRQMPLEGLVRLSIEHADDVFA